MDKNVDELIAELAERGVQLPKGTVRIGGFGDSEALSESLVALILTGVKRGTCSLVWSWDFDGETLPDVGDMEIVLDWHGRPMFVRRTTEVEVVPFDAVTAEHWRFFTDECQRIGRTVDKSMPLVCERFEVLHTFA